MRRLTALTLLASLALAPTAFEPPAEAMCRAFVRPQQPVLVKGDQRVFIFHRNGMQHLVLQNSFKGKATDFGMVLPLPAPPEVKKVDRKFFAQLITLTHQRGGIARKQAAGRADGDQSDPRTAPPVVVLDRAVVGVFEAVTLAAKTARSLTDWLDKHKYTYDKTSKELFADYVERGWIFVAIRTKLGAKVTSFDGAMQPMGFRFPTKKPVLPVRMAAANPKGMMFDMYIVAEHGVSLPDFPQNFCKHRAKLLASPAIHTTLTASTALGRELARDTLLDDTRPDRGLGGPDGLGNADSDRVNQMRKRLAPLFISRFRGFFPRATMLRRDLVIEKHDPSVANVRAAINSAVATGSYGAETLASAVTTDAAFKALTANTTHADYRVRRLVAEALGKVGACVATRKRPSITHLISMLRTEKDDFVKSGIVRSLRALSGKSFPTYDIKKWIAWYEASQK